MKVVEVFYSLQGEGRLAGVPSVFIRLAGCPLRCRWCDTPYALDPHAGTELDTEAIVRRVSQWPARFVVITGGEPMATADLRPRPGLVGLTRRLKAEGYHVTVETAGVLCIPDLACDLMSLSPKLDHADSSRGRRMAAGGEEVLRELVAGYDYQLKFVVESPTDAAEIKGVLERLGGADPLKVMLMAQAQTCQELAAKSPMVAQMCLENGWVFCPRLHIQLWGGQQGR